MKFTLQYVKQRNDMIWFRCSKNHSGCYVRNRVCREVGDLLTGERQCGLEQMVVEGVVRSDYILNTFSEQS